jgi:hypothetical protein
MYVFLAFIVCFVIAIVLAMRNFPEANANLGWGPAFYPYFLIFLLTIFSVIELCQTYKMKDKPLGITLKGVRNPVIVVTIIVLYAILLKILGFIVCSFLYLLLLMQILKADMKNSIMTSLGVVAFLYVLFRYIFKVPLPVASFLGS